MKIYTVIFLFFNSSVKIQLTGLVESSTIHTPWSWMQSLILGSLCQIISMTVQVQPVSHQGNRQGFMSKRLYILKILCTLCNNLWAFCICPASSKTYAHFVISLTWHSTEMSHFVSLVWWWDRNTTMDWCISVCTTTWILMLMKWWLVSQENILIVSLLWTFWMQTKNSRLFDKQSWSYEINKV